MISCKRAVSPAAYRHEQHAVAVWLSRGRPPRTGNEITSRFPKQLVLFSGVYQGVGYLEGTSGSPINGNDYVSV